ncbi:MAG: hypothetical protein LUF33_01815 [Clostridiales bacterium]|nr:hypothetical protein [Clostridiales bacterium]
MKKTLSLALIAVFCLLLCSCGGSGSAQSIAEKAARGQLEDDIDAYYSCLAPDYIAYMVGDDGWYSSEDEFKEDIREYNYEDERDYFSEECGEDFTASYNPLNPTEFDEEEYQDIISDLTNNYNYDESSIQDLAQVEVSVTAAGSSGTQRGYKTFSCVKINGKWYIHRPGFDV